MKPTIQEITNGIANAISTTELFTILCAGACSLGYPFCSLVVRMPEPIFSVPVMRFDNFPPESTVQPTSRSGAHIGWKATARFYDGAETTLAFGAGGLRPDGAGFGPSHVAWEWLEEAHKRVTALVLQNLLPQARASFSTKELEVLRWTGEGKTSGEIGMIMGLSSATINFHIRNLLQKTGSVNRTHAAVRAVALGILPIRLVSQAEHAC